MQFSTLMALAASKLNYPLQANSDSIYIFAASILLNEKTVFYFFIGDNIDRISTG
jgi:hypothetical protein